MTTISSAQGKRSRGGGAMKTVPSCHYRAGHSHLYICLREGNHACYFFRVGLCPGVQEEEKTWREVTALV